MKIVDLARQFNVGIMHIDSKCVCMCVCVCMCACACVCECVLVLTSVVDAAYCCCETTFFQFSDCF